MENVKLQNEALRVQISPCGAEIQSILDEKGIERIWQGDPAIWASRTPVLFPVAGAYKEDTYMLDGKAYAMGKHGFTRNRMFKVEEASAQQATFLLEGKAGEEPGFPFAYAFRVRFRLEGSAVIVDYTVNNLGDTTFYYSTGAHEGYACPGGIAGYEVAFEKPEPLEIGVLDGSLLTYETQLLPSKDGVLALRDELFINDALAFQTLASRSVTLRSKKDGSAVRVDFADYPYLLLWTKVGAPYLCIEPWGNLPDYIDSDQDITSKPGMVALAPGGQHTQTHSLHFS